MYLTHFDIIDVATMFSPMTQKPDILTWLIVMLLPACATWSWHQLTIKLVVLQSFGNSTGCYWVSCWISHFCIPSPILNTPCASTYESSLNNLIFASNFCLLSKTNFFSKIPTLYHFYDLHFCCLHFSETNQYVSAISMYFCWRYLICLDWFELFSFTKQKQCNDPFQLQPIWNFVFHTC